MGLNCLLLTGDATLLEVIRTGFSATSVQLEMRTDAASAIELSARRHLDGFVIDCDDVPGATDLLAEIRGSRSNKTAVVVAVVNGTTSVSMAVDAGANFVLGKPVLDRQLQSLLDVALPRMEREHRRYFRHKVDLPVELLCYTGETFVGKLINVSAGGLALTHFGPAALEGVVTVQFGLPSTESQTFQAKASVVWNDAATMGLRFLRNRACLPFRFRGLAGFPRIAAAIPRVSAIERRGVEGNLRPKHVIRELLRAHRRACHWCRRPANPLI